MKLSGLGRGGYGMRVEWKGVVGVGDMEWGGGEGRWSAGYGEGV